VNTETNTKYGAEDVPATPVSALVDESPVEGMPFSMYFASTLIRDELSVQGLEMRALGPAAGTAVSSRNAVTEPSQYRRFEQAPEQQLEPEPGGSANAARVTLLARKYVAKNGFSPEEEARLAIVTERVRQLVPAVTVREVEALEQLFLTLKKVEQSDNEVRDVLGLPKKGDGSPL
jgi:hypothetical protein